jgi:hypothetical protein
MVSGQQGRMATGAIAVLEEDSMHPTTMQAIAAQRGDDLYTDAATARRARQARRGRSWQPVQPVQQARPVQQSRPVVPMCLCRELDGPEAKRPDSSGLLLGVYRNGPAPIRASDI